MTEKESALYSQYIIDGVKFDASPAELLEECVPVPQKIADNHFDDIVDESMDPPVSTFTYDLGRIKEYIQACREAAGRRTFSILYPYAFTRQRIATALIHRLWNDGQFRLEDLSIWARWYWDIKPLGNMASFYMSAESAGAYLFDLGVKLQHYSFEEMNEGCFVNFFAWLPETEELSKDEDIQLKAPFENTHPWISEDMKCSLQMLPDELTEIIYIPFDTCRFNLGGSLFAQLYGKSGGTEPHIQDPDYFIDCYEVVRELVEDGIVMAATTVGTGGLATELSKFCDGNGLSADISGLMASYQENDAVKILFSEVPGVILQVSRTDCDYLDSQLLLQDVAYYPLGHPDSKFSGLEFTIEKKADVSGILASLLGQASEGED